ncbi:MAG TPA: hypothetical protein VNM37_17725, partial [Candidatus Dormibacteraeota bacterium]|nr:hypothetical protein [Candidatus Dormibacteraeota bacterium]
GMSTYNWSISYDGGAPASVGGNSDSVTFTVHDSIGTLTVLLNITNANGCANQCSKVVEINPPEAGCIVTLNSQVECKTADIQYSLSVGAPAGSTYLWDIISDSSGASITSGQGSTSIRVTAGTCGSYTVKVTITFPNQHQETCETTTVVVDSQPPTISAAGSNATIECPATPIFTPPTATDACDPNPQVMEVSDVSNPGSCPGAYTRTKTWKAMDACGNMSGMVSQTITVLDTTPPVIVCQADRTNEWVTGAVPVFGNPTASDACDPNLTITFVDSELPASCPAVRIFRRTWTSTDDCTNSASCSQTITFVDTTPPVIACQADRTNEWVTGAVPVFGNP